MYIGSFENKWKIRKFFVDRLENRSLVKWVYANFLLITKFEIEIS